VFNGFEEQVSSVNGSEEQRAVFSPQRESENLHHIPFSFP
jgi:hypothetical protein